MIGVFGGTFDPIHFGHLRPALELLHQLQLEEVRFVPCRNPPHRDTPSATVEQRLRMLRLAIAGVAGFRIDCRELERDGPSYMFDTLTSLRAELPRARFCLLLGMDALLGFQRWYRWQEILQLTHIVGAHRPGWVAPTEGELAQLLNTRHAANSAALEAHPAGLVLLQPVTQLEISATSIRTLVGAGASPRFLLPDAVSTEIERNAIYRNQ